MADAIDNDAASAEVANRFAKYGVDPTGGAAPSFSPAPPADNSAPLTAPEPEPDLAEVLGKSKVLKSAPALYPGKEDPEVNHRLMRGESEEWPK